jgi:hypothetical protein
MIRPEASTITECEKEVIWNSGPVPVVGHPDAIHKKDGAVIEWLTSYFHNQTLVITFPFFSISSL